MNSMNPKMLRERVENITALPTVPSVLQQVSLIIGNSKISIDEISRFVSNDPALTVKILKMVNSAFYGFPGRISSVSHAVMLLGLNVVKGLLLGISVFELMQKSMLGLREHSLGCAVAARLIAKRMGLKDPEEVSIAGLLHDIGKVVLILAYPGEYQAAMNEAEAKGRIIVEAEKDHFADNHAGAGMLLTSKWQFPLSLVEVIHYHHSPRLSRNFPVETAIIHFSDILVRARGVGFAGDRLVPAIDPKAFAILDLAEAEIRDILKEMEDSLASAEEEFLGE